MLYATNMGYPSLASMSTLLAPALMIEGFKVDADDQLVLSGFELLPQIEKSRP